MSLSEKTDQRGFTPFSGDIETDGPTVGVNPMISFAFVAYDPEGNEIDSFKRNILPRDEFVQDEDTMLEFWAKKPESIRIAATEGAVTAEVAMTEAYEWIQTTKLDKTRPCAIYFPAAFDHTFLSYYFKHFSAEKKCPFHFNVIDGATFAMGKFDLNRRYAALRHLYKRFLTEEETNHTHDALDDARTQGKLYFRMRATPRDPVSASASTKKAKLVEEEVSQ